MPDPLTHDGALDALILNGGQPFDPSDAKDSSRLNVAHDAATLDGEPRVAGIDWDKPRSVRISLAGQEIFTLAPDEFIDWYRDNAATVCDVICFERPHLRPRGDFSRAQIWTADDLERLVGGPPIRMPNGKKLHKMAAHAGNQIEVKIEGKAVLKPDKKKDAESIRRYAEDFPTIRDGWKLFVPPSQDRSLATHDHRDALRHEIGRTINEWRDLWQDVSGKDAIRALEFIAPAAAILDEAFDNLSDECKEVFKLTRSKGTVNLAQGKTRIMTVYAMTYDKNHNLRMQGGRPIGRRYLMKDVVGLCDSYMPNMARANLTGYGKTGLAGVDSRSKLNRAVKEMLRVFQDHGHALTLDGASVTNDLLMRDGDCESLTNYGRHQQDPSTPDVVQDAATYDGGPAELQEAQHDQDHR